MSSPLHLRSSLARVFASARGALSLCSKGRSFLNGKGRALARAFWLLPGIALTLCGAAVLFDPALALVAGAVFAVIVGIWFCALVVQVLRGLRVLRTVATNLGGQIRISSVIQQNRSSFEQSEEGEVKKVVLH